MPSSYRFALFCLAWLGTYAPWSGALAQTPAPVVPATAGPTSGPSSASSRTLPSILLAPAATSGTDQPAARLAEARPESLADPNPVRPGLPPYGETLGMETATLAVDWVTPETILIGQEGNFELVLRNRGRIAVEQITVEQALPTGFRLVEAKPAPVDQKGEPVWKIARLEPQQEVRISLRLVPEKVGTAESHARVQFVTSSSTNFRVVEPKLALQAESPQNALVGDQAVFFVTVNNPGTGKTTNTILNVEFPEHLVPVSDTTQYKIGLLNPGESRSVRVLAKVNGLGLHTCRFVATADHGLVQEAERQIEGLGAKLEIAVTGPTFRYVSRPADYTVRVKNTGTAGASNVYVRCHVPEAFAYLSSEAGGRFDSTTKYISWFVGSLDVGQEFVGQFKLRADKRGSFPIEAESEAERGLHAKAVHTTEVEGIAAILLEVVDIDDPVEVGADTAYEILVTNQGTDFAKDINVLAKLPEGAIVLDCQGPTEWQVDGETIRFSPLPKLAPRADAIYRIHIRYTQPGDTRMEVQASAESLDLPVKELESTKVYQD